jgi:hypothetical protein
MTNFEQVIRGLQIIGKYPQPNIDAQHDIIYASYKCEHDEDYNFIDCMTKEDGREMKKCGWHKNEDEIGHWERFV